MLALLESYTLKFPPEILNEIRDIFDHMMRIGSDGVLVDDNSILSEFDAADRHLTRAVLDCYKHLLLYFADRRGEFWKESKKYEVKNIDDGKFYVQMKEIEQECIDYDAKAKIAESRNKSEAIELYAKAIERAIAVNYLLTKHTGDIIRAIKITFIRKWIVTPLIWFALTLLAAFIAIAVNRFIGNC
jgi:tRNA(Leu) C34 or U34 (ribose-2'-O)-methylase TrmL